MTQVHQSSDIELHLTYNREKGLPRNFFIHLYHVPLDATVSVVYNGRELPSPNLNGYVDVRFSIEPDTQVGMTVMQGEKVIGFSTYLLHGENVFERTLSGKGISLHRVTYMSGR